GIVVSFPEWLLVAIQCQFGFRVFTLLLLVGWVLKCLLLPSDGLVEIPNFGIGAGQRVDVAGVLPACEFACLRSFLDRHLSIPALINLGGRANPGAVVDGRSVLRIEANRLGVVGKGTVLTGGAVLVLNALHMPREAASIPERRMIGFELKG